MNSKAWGTVFLPIPLLILAGCASNGPSRLNPPSTVEALMATSGTPQSHTVNGPFGEPLVVTVMTNGSPTGGVTVKFAAPSTGASGTFSDTGKNITTATTNSSGVATAPAFSANGMAGSYAVTASITKGPDPVSFNLTNTIGAPASISPASGSTQSATVNTPFASPLSVTVVDGGHNPVSNAIVVFTAPSTGASGIFADSGSNTTSATTNANGMATSAAFTANGKSGANTVTATVSGVLSPASFNLTNVAGPPAALAPLGGVTQSTVGNTPFPVPLTASVVDNLQNPVIGAQVTFTAPSTGASGTFAGAPTNSITVATDTNGIATAPTLTANATSGPYTVTGTVTGISTAINYNLNNWTGGSKLYSFTLTGQEVSAGFPVFYGVLGSVVIDPNGNVIAGEQDYNDAFGNTSPQPSGDTITGGTMTVSSTTGGGTLTLITNNPSLGVSGTETLAVQFVNLNHALIIQFDGSATSSGSLDVQNVSAAPASGGYAFAMTGVDPSFGPVSFGGVFSISAGTNLPSGMVDMNDFGTVTPATPISGTLSAPDSFGRGSINSSLSYSYIGIPLNINYYMVGPEVLRIIDVDALDSAIGSAYGQGANATSASTASLPNSIFGIEGNTLSNVFSAAGQLSTNSASSSFSGVADDGELLLGLSIPDAPISGTYSISSNGYGTLTISPGLLGDISSLGIYLTDPKLNLTDPNNTTSGLGGALIVDMDTLLSGGTGLVITQTDTSTASFTGSYVFGAQDQNFFDGLFDELDFLAQGTIDSSGAIHTLGELSDPSLALVGGATTYSSVNFDVYSLADPSNPGRYDMSVHMYNPKDTAWFNVAAYQADGGQLLWVNVDPLVISEYFGFMQQQGSLTGLPAAKAGKNVSTPKSRSTSKR